MKAKIKGILIAISIMLLLSMQASAYVPKEYQTSPYMSSYDVYKVSLNHIGDKWADYNLEDLMKWYGRPRCLPCLDTSMERRKEIEEKNSPKPIIRVQKMPSLPKISMSK